LQRLVKILFEIASARIEDAESEIHCVDGRHFIRRLTGRELE
jgi:hypothetical protein